MAILTIMMNVKNTMSKDKEEKDMDKDKEKDIVTIRDFKSMIVGMDMIMGDDWTPDAKQWKRIRAKIDALIETADHSRPAGVLSSPASPTASPPTHTHSTSTDALLKGFPEVPSSIPGDVPVGEPGPAGPSALAPPPVMPSPAMPSNAPVADGREKVKTPDIDTSKGYKSGYV